MAAWHLLSHLGLLIYKGREELTNSRKCSSAARDPSSTARRAASAAGACAQLSLPSVLHSPPNLATISALLLRMNAASRRAACAIWFQQTLSCFT